jgi:hypothetical protein
MNRDQLSELLSAYLDGEVDDRERALVERVLREDASARRLLEELRRTVNAVGSLPRHAAPPTLAADLDARLERAELLGGAETHPVPIQERRAPWTAWLAMAAMLGVVVVAGWWFLLDRGQHGVGRAENKVATADARRERVAADGPAPPSAAIGPAGREALASRAAALTVESQMAAGVDPAALTRQSFAPETVRLQVVAVNAAERDALAERLIKRLSEQKTENLAKRGSRAGRSKEPVDSFFLVGKAGVNFDDPQQRQVLVRVPRSQAAQVVDDLTAVAGSEDRVALQAGPIAVRGAASARNLLQMVGQMPPEADAAAKEPKPTEGESKTEFADKRAERAGGPVESAKKPADSNRFDPLSGLMKIVGLDADALSRRSGRIGERIGKTGNADEEARRETGSVAAAQARGKAPDADTPASSGAAASPQPTSPEKKDIAESAPDTTTEESRSLVRRRQVAAEKALARAKTAKDTSTVRKETVGAFKESESVRLGAAGAKGAAGGAGETGTVVKQDDYVTIVIEFVVPSTQPKPPPTPKPTTVPASKSSQ